jgi:hypothetical protein
MSEVQKQHIPLSWKLSKKAKALRFQPGAMMGALETPSRVKMNAKSGRP